MQRTQVFLRNDQQQVLRKIANRTGRKQSDLIRSGVDLLIEQQQKELIDWQQALKNARGMWQDRQDIDTLQQDIRDGLNTRYTDIIE